MATPETVGLGAELVRRPDGAFHRQRGAFGRRRLAEAQTRHATGNGRSGQRKRIRFGRSRHGQTGCAKKSEEEEAGHGNGEMTSRACRMPFFRALPRKKSRIFQSWQNEKHETKPKNVRNKYCSQKRTRDRLKGFTRPISHAPNRFRPSIFQLRQVFPFSAKRRNRSHPGNSGWRPNG